MTPYEAINVQQPPSIISYLPSTSTVWELGNLLQSHDFTLSTLKDNLVMGQNCMNQQVDQHHSEWVFEVGDQVFLCLQLYKHISLKSKGHHKLAPKFYGPYQILQCIGLVT